MVCISRRAFGLLIVCRFLSLLQYLRSQLEVTVDATLRRLPAPQLDAAAPIPDPSPTHLAPRHSCIYISTHAYTHTAPQWQSGHCCDFKT